MFCLCSTPPAARCHPISRRPGRKGIRLWEQWMPALFVAHFGQPGRSRFLRRRRWPRAGYPNRRCKGPVPDDLAQGCGQDCREPPPCAIEHRRGRQQHMRAAFRAPADRFAALYADRNPDQAPASHDVPGPRGPSRTSLRTLSPGTSMTGQRTGEIARAAFTAVAPVAASPAARGRRRPQPVARAGCRRA